MQHFFPESQSNKSLKVKCLCARCLKLCFESFNTTTCKQKIYRIQKLWKLGQRSKDEVLPHFQDSWNSQYAMMLVWATNKRKTMIVPDDSILIFFSD